MGSRSSQCQELVFFREMDSGRSSKLGYTSEMVVCLTLDLDRFLCIVFVPRWRVP